MLKKFVTVFVLGFSLSTNWAIGSTSSDSRRLAGTPSTSDGEARSPSSDGKPPESVRTTDDLKPAEKAKTPAAKPPGNGSTVAQIKARGALRCGASSALEGFGQIDDKGNWFGFDVDFCRALAVAVLGDANKIQFIPLTARERFAALHQGLIDVLDRSTTWTLSRESLHDLLFTGVTYYDGQGFLVRKSLGVNSALDLPSSSICVQQDTTTELNLADFFRQRGLKYQPKIYPTSSEVEGAYASGQCGAYTTDASALFVMRAGLKDPENHIILPQIISKEPLGPAVRQGDDQWFSIVRWALIAMIDAEEMGVSQSNVDEMAKSDNPRIKRLLGIEGNYGEPLGLTSDWAYRIIKFVGNYDDIFRRNLGEGSKLKIKRGLNELWTKGGLLYAPPIQ